MKWLKRGKSWNWRKMVWTYILWTMHFNYEFKTVDSVVTLHVSRTNVSLLNSIYNTITLYKSRFRVDEYNKMINYNNYNNNNNNINNILILLIFFCWLYHDFIKTDTQSSTKSWSGDYPCHKQRFETVKKKNTKN